LLSLYNILAIKSLSIKFLKKLQIVVLLNNY
jgi:hypothetical protein